MPTTAQLVIDDLKTILQLCNEAQTGKENEGYEEQMLYMYNALHDIKIYANQAIETIKGGAV
jgi:hypothetical protein